MQLKSMIAGAAFASALWVAPAFAQELVFTLDNQSSGDINELYVSTLDSNSWEEDILGQDVLAAGEQATVTISNTDGRCEFDVRLVYDDGSITDERKINLCDLEDSTYAVTD
jgi:hypothetical protein